MSITSSPRLRGRAAPVLQSAPFLHCRRFPAAHATRVGRRLLDGTTRTNSLARELRLKGMTFMASSTVLGTAGRTFLYMSIGFWHSRVKSANG